MASIGALLLGIGGGLIYFVSYERSSSFRRTFIGIKNPLFAKCWRLLCYWNDCCLDVSLALHLPTKGLKSAAIRNHKLPKTKHARGTLKASHDYYLDFWLQVNSNHLHLSHSH